MKKITISYYGNKFNLLSELLVIVADRLGVEFNFVHSGSCVDIIDKKYVLSDIFIYDVSDIDEDMSSEIFRTLLNDNSISKSRVFANIEGNKFAEKYCLSHHEVPFEVPYNNNLDFVIWYTMIHRFFLS
jgi:hypothetical protein